MIKNTNDTISDANAYIDEDNARITELGNNRNKTMIIEAFVKYLAESLKCHPSKLHLIVKREQLEKGFQESYSIVESEEIDELIETMKKEATAIKIDLIEGQTKNSINLLKWIDALPSEQINKIKEILSRLSEEHQSYPLWMN